MYEKQTWASGDVITAEKLNHIEDGVAAGGVAVATINYSNSSYSCNMTAQAICDLLDSGVPVFGYYMPQGYGLFKKSVGAPYAHCTCSLTQINSEGKAFGTYFSYDDTNGMSATVVNPQ